MGYIDKEAYKAKYLCCGYLPEMSEEEFDGFPEADVMPVVHGKWTRGHWKGDVSCANCSVCGAEVYHREYRGVQKYYRCCPKCMSLMDLEIQDRETNMKFKNPKTGEVFDNIREARATYCTFVGSCFMCKIPKQGCVEYCLEHPREAAELMGYEVVEEEKSRAHKRKMKIKLWRFLKTGLNRLMLFWWYGAKTAKTRRPMKIG